MILILTKYQLYGADIIIKDNEFVLLPMSIHEICIKMDSTLIAESSGSEKQIR